MENEPEISYSRPKQLREFISIDDILFSVSVLLDVIDFLLTREDFSNPAIIHILDSIYIIADLIQNQQPHI